MNFRTLCMALTALATLPAASFAIDMATVEKEVAADMKAKISPAIIAAIKAQNTEHASLDAAGITKLDNEWKAETTAADKPFINKVLSNTTSAELKKIMDASGGKYVEIFVMDNKGLNVGQTGITSDYWQGDEAKFTGVFPKVGATTSTAPEFDESAQAFVAEVNGTIADGTTAIGTYTVKISAE
ncbi:MAG: hypothetical protein DI628_00100 [Blastochloris viridis]|uniref:Uncharacterized protein n=1 Tax=Blastochloris viridis TaxID=1079 RepID=A0A6N4R6I4_BLAVI|nr:MAG: hypothetical protein DI628_00100 [Blastochloris viridis]